MGIATFYHYHDSLISSAKQVFSTFLIAKRVAAIAAYIAVFGGFSYGATIVSQETFTQDWGSATGNAPSSVDLQALFFNSLGGGCVAGTISRNGPNCFAVDQVFSLQDIGATIVLNPPPLPILLT